MPDFTQKRYAQLIMALQSQGFFFQPFRDYIKSPKENSILLRHDVDRIPEKSLQIAKLQMEYGIKGSYYFRILPCSYNEDIIKQIADLGHEIGYHYEDLSLTKGNIDNAYTSFCKNLEKFRKLYPVKTICMHGNPRSKWDSKDIWKKYNYKLLGIIGEPYFDINFNNIFYLTDTGRRWDGWKYSLRDKVPQQEKWIQQGLIYHTTKDIIIAVKRNKFPESAMFTFHPQRWSNKLLPWVRELILQNLKNIIKQIIIEISNP